MRSGTSRAGARAASSHTAALASSDAAVDALFWQAGVLRARTLEELLDAAVLFSTQPLPRGNRVAVLTNAGGLGILCADACEAAGLDAAAARRRDGDGARSASFPAEASVANPVDILGSATAATYEAALPLLLADPGIDAVIVLFVPPVVATAADVAAAIARASAGADKPVLPVVMSADGTPRGRLRVSRVGRPRARARRAPRRVAAPPGRRAAASSTRIDRAAAAALIVDAALARRATTSGSSRRTRARCSRRTACRSSRSAMPRRRRGRARRGARVGYPVVVKTAAAGAHKTESGGVHLDLRDAGSVAPRVRSDRRAGDRAAVRHRRRRAARRRDPGSGLRTARRVRAGRRLRRADRLDAASRSRRSRTSTPTSCIASGKAGTARRRAGAARRLPTVRRIADVLHGSAGSRRTTPRSPSSI